MARKKRRRVASRGSVNNIILKTLVNGDKYGYEIIKEVEDYSNGKIKLKQPSLYSSLSRFEDKKFVTSYWGDSDIGGRRHYYHLTELGMQYYRKAILKEDEDDDNDDIDEEELNQLEEIMANNLTEENNNEVNETIIEDEPSSDINESEDTTEDVIENDIPKSQYSEISENEIPAIINFDKTESLKEEPIIPDHSYFKSTPMDNIIINKESHNNEQTTLNQNSASNNSNVDIDSPWLALSNQVKSSNARIAKSTFATLYFKKPKKVQKVILDRDGIYKLRDEDYVDTNKNQKAPTIIDNVRKRTKLTNIYGYTTYTEDNNKPTSKPYSELTDEEKRKRNENFLAKFNLITNSKMKPISSPPPQKIEPKEPEKPIDYRGKLNAIIESNYYEEDPIVDIEENNLYNYQDDDWNKTESTTNSILDINNNDDDESVINLEPTHEFETKALDNKYIEEINNYTTTANEVKINRYESRSQAILSDKTFVLINKLKFVFGIILTLLMTTEVTLSYIILKNNELVMNSDKAIIILSYVIIAIFAGIYIIPYCLNAQQHKANNFKMKYAVWFGILTFLVLTILIYCFNALIGFELDNFKFFAVKLIMPLVLSFNFIIGPIIYGILNKNKRFYD